MFNGKDRIALVFTIDIRHWLVVEAFLRSLSVFAPTSADANTYVIIEHPELRSADARDIVISYSRPTELFRGDVRLARITLR